MYNTQIKINISKVAVLQQKGYPDKIRIRCDLPVPIYPFASHGCILETDAAHGHGCKFVKENFGIEPEIIKA